MRERGAGRGDCDSPEGGRRKLGGSEASRRVHKGDGPQATAGSHVHVDGHTSAHHGLVQRMGRRPWWLASRRCLCESTTAAGIWVKSRWCPAKARSLSLHLPCGSGRRRCFMCPTTGEAGSGWGFDCSGLVSLAASLRGRAVPRDASQQFLVGLDVEPDSCRMDDVAFFCNPEGRITHVGLCDGQGHILHASGEVRLDLLREGQILQFEDHKPTHTLAGIRRWFP